MNTAKKISSVITKYLPEQCHPAKFWSTCSYRRILQPRKSIATPRQILNGKVEMVLTGAAVRLLISPPYGAETAVMGANIESSKVHSPYSIAD